jgi:hypothetical protein
MSGQEVVSRPRTGLFHTSLARVSSMTPASGLFQGRVDQAGTVWGGPNADCQSRENSVAHGHALGRCRISFLAR